MKVTIITSFPFPDGKATSNRVRAFAEELVNSGFAKTVRILATSPNSKEIYNFAEQIEVESLQVPLIDKKKLFFRAINEVNVAFKLWRMVRKKRQEIIIVTIPSIFLLVPLLFIVKREKLVIDVRDAVWTYFKESFFARSLSKLFGFIFSITAKKADLVSVTNLYESKYVEALTDKSPIIVPNGLSMTKLKEFESIENKNIGKNINLTYIGNIGIAQELDILIAFSQYFPTNLTINIIGDGAMLSTLVNICKDKKINNIIFHGSVPSSDVPSYMEMSDILFAQIGNDFKSAIPTKIFEYIASGRKVLCGLPSGPAKETFTAFHGVEIFSPGNLCQMKLSYKKLLDKKFGNYEREYNLELLKSTYIREKNLKDFLSILYKI